MKLAACYIVKNEAEDLRKSLESVEDAVDEIVVVDTGSEDATADVASSFGAKLCFYQWHDHFADARNFALAQVKSPWVIFLDADEAFLHPKEVRPAIEEYLESNPNPDGLMLVRYDIDMDCGGKVRGHDLALRVIRNAPNLRYKGRIHEHLSRQDGTALELVFADERLALSHTGYSSGRIRHKALRDLALLEKDVEAAGGVADPFLNGHLADAYYLVGEYQKALECALLALDSEVRFVGAQGSKYHVALESMRRLDMPPEDMLPLARLATQELPELPEFYGEQGIILSAMGRLEEAKELLQKAIAVHREHPVNYREASYFDDDARAIVYQRLGEISHLQGEEEAAEAYFRDALRIAPENGSVRETYARFLREREA